MKECLDERSDTNKRFRQALRFSKPTKISSQKSNQMLKLSRVYTLCQGPRSIPASLARTTLEYSQVLLSRIFSNSHVGGQFQRKCFGDVKLGLSICPSEANCVRVYELHVKCVAACLCLLAFPLFRAEVLPMAYCSIWMLLLPVACFHWLGLFLLLCLGFDLEPETH